MEIERKFKINNFPKDLILLDEAEVKQGYISTEPVVRIREIKKSRGFEYYLTIKGEGRLIREEIEWEIDENKFKKLSKIINNTFILKKYKTYKLNGYKLECSRVNAKNIEQFYYAEIEFSSLKEAVNFKPPDFLKEELTYKKGTSMNEIWKRCTKKE